MIYSSILRSLVDVAVCLLTIVPLQAQQGGTALGGTVLDPSGKVLPNATVVIKNEGSDFSRTFNTDEEGRFSAAGLPSGTYTIEVSAPGFATTVRMGQETGTGGSGNITISVWLR